MNVRLPADWSLGDDGLVRSPFRPPMPLAEALVLRQILTTSSKPHNRVADPEPPAP